MNFYIKIQENPVKFKTVEISDETIKTLISKDYGYDIEEINLIESGQVIDYHYNEWKAAFICGIRETLKMIYNKDIIL